MITGLLGLAMQPWKLMATPDSYILGWLVGYSGLMGPIAGIMICDYLFIRRTKLSIFSLYHRDGIYHYTKGINPRAITALAVGVVVALIGVWVPSLRFLYDYSWFVGLFLSGLIYAVLMRLSPVPILESAELTSR